MGKAADIIKQQLTESDDSYVTAVREVEVYGLSSNGNVYADGGSATIHWDVDWDVRDYGIKGLNVMIKSLQVSWETVDGSGEEDVKAPGELSWNLGDETWKVEAEFTNIGNNGHFMLVPSSVDVHLHEKRVTVHF